MAKKLHIIPDEEYLDGFCEMSEDRASYSVCVNIEKLWNYAVKHSKRPVDYFIRAFSKTYTHELIHILIRQSLPTHTFSENSLFEEKTVYSMLGERWNKKLKKYYK